MKTNILPNDNDKKNEIKLELKCLKELEEVQVLVNKLDFDNSLTAEEFVQFNKSEITDKIISDKEILKTVILNKQDKKKEKDSLLIITHSKTIRSFDKVIYI